MKISMLRCQRRFYLFEVGGGEKDKKKEKKRKETLLQYASGSTFITRRTATCDAPLNVPVKRTRPRAKEGARRVLGRQGWQGCKRGQVRGWDGKGRFRTETSTRPVAAGAAGAAGGAGVQGGGAEHLLSFGCIAHNQGPSTKL